MVKELSAHLVIGSLHIKLDSREAAIDKTSLEVMYAFLHNQNIVKNAIATHKCAMLKVDQMRKNGLQFAYQNLGISLVKIVHKMMGL